MSGDNLTVMVTRGCYYHCMGRQQNIIVKPKMATVLLRKNIDRFLGHISSVNQPGKCPDVSQGGHQSSLASLLYTTRHLFIEMTALPLCPLEPRGHDSSDLASSRLSLCPFRLLSTQMGLCTPCIYKSACYHLCWDPDC